jgi:hypothetical protein
MSLSKKVTIEFEVTDDGIETSSVRVLFNDMPVCCLSKLDLSLDVDKTFGFFTVIQSRALGCKELAKLVESYNAKTTE